jgi:uncharacterized protein YbbC (DUF1343 family)
VIPGRGCGVGVVGSFCPFTAVYNKMPDKSKFFARAEFFDKLAGTDELRKQILAGKTEDQIRESWKPELDEYKKMRKQYLIYPDFE